MSNHDPYSDSIMTRLSPDCTLKAVVHAAAPFRSDVECRANLVTRLGPVFDIESLDTAKFPSVVGHKSQPKGTGMCRDEKIVGADHGPVQFETGANLGIVEGRFIGKIQNLDMSQICIERGLVLLPSWRYLDAIHEFGLGDDGDTDIADRDAWKSTQNSGVGTLHDVRRYVGIEHVDGHQSSRSWTGRSSSSSRNSSEATGPEVR